MDPSQSGADGTVGLDQNERERNGVRVSGSEDADVQFLTQRTAYSGQLSMAASAQSQPYIREQMDLSPNRRGLLLAPSSHRRERRSGKHHRRQQRQGKSAPNFTIASQRLAGLGLQMARPGSDQSGNGCRPALNTKPTTTAGPAGPTPDAFKNYPDDHANCPGYMFQFTPEEQRRLGGEVRWSSGTPVGKKSARKSGNSPAQVAGNARGSRARPGLRAQWLYSVRRNRIMFRSEQCFGSP
jgi:hypothetical protein